MKQTHQTTMRLLFTVFFLLIITVSLFCQENNKGYGIQNEYTTDSTGKIVVVTGLKYQRIVGNGYWGYIDSIGNILIPLGKYSFINPMDKQGMILARKDGKEGFIDLNDNVLIPFIYENLGVFSECVQLAPAVKNNKQGFINRKGETVIPFEYDYASYLRYFYEPGIVALLKNGKHGVINAENKIIIPFIYDKIDFSSRDDIIIAWKQKEWTCFSTDGKQLSDFNNYEIVKKSPLGYLPKDSKNLPILVTTKENKNYAFLDKHHNFVVPFGVYDYADVFGLGRKAIVANKGKYGIIDEYGKLVLPLEYDFVEQPSLWSNYAKIFVATKNDTVRLFDENANIIPINDVVSYIDDYYGCLIVTNRENKMGSIDYSGKQIIPFLYDTLYLGWTISSVDGYIAKKDGFYGFISQNNEIIQPFQYNYIYGINKKVVYVDQNNKVGILNKDGSIIIPFEYDVICGTTYHHRVYSDSFQNTKYIYIVEKDEKIGTIDDKNNVIIPIIYDGLSSGSETHFVKNNDKYGIISHKGEIIIPIEYDYVGRPQSGVIAVRKNGKYGVVSWENKEILPCIYDRVILDAWFDIGEKKEPKIVVLQKNVWKYYDLNGKLIQSKVHLKEIDKEYGYILNWGEPSNEHYDFGIIQKGELKRRISEK